MGFFVASRRSGSGSINESNMGLDSRIHANEEQLIPKYIMGITYEACFWNLHSPFS